MGAGSIGHCVPVRRAGAGKSYLAVAALAYVLHERIFEPADCRFIREADYLDNIKATFGNGEVSPRNLPPNHSRRVKVLVYDDLAAGLITGWRADEIKRLLEGRHADNLATIITSNIRPGEITSAIDGRLASRIAESRLMLELPARDLRVHGCARLSGRPSV